MQIIAIDNLNYSNEENEGDEPPPRYFIELDPIDEEIENEETFFDLDDIDMDIEVINCTRAVSCENLGHCRVYTKSIFDNFRF